MAATNDLQKTLLKVHVGSPDHLVYEGQAISITTANEKGPLDILPAHENFISIIKDKLVILDAANNTKNIPIDVAVLHVNENNVEVFVGIPTIELAESSKTTKLPFNLRSSS